MGFNISPNKRKLVEDTGFRCSHCGRATGNFAGGFARGLNGEPLCHPNAKNRPDCHKLVTVYRHKTPCEKAVCYENHADGLIYIGEYIVTKKADVNG